MFKLKIVCQTNSKELQKSTSYQYALYHAFYVEYLSNIHTLFLKKNEIQNLKVLPNLWGVYLICAHATNQIHKEG